MVNIFLLSWPIIRMDLIIVILPFIGVDRGLPNIAISISVLVGRLKLRSHRRMLSLVES